MARVPSLILRCVVLASASSLLLGSDCLGYYPPEIDAALDAPEPDAPMGCTTAADVTMGGVFSGNTCTGFDQVRLTCGRVGAQEQWFVIDQSLGCFDYTFSTTPGFVVQAQLFTEVLGCLPARGSGCTLGLDGPADCGTHTHFLIVERADGGCGAFELTVTARPS